jgi:hypothetical protein
MLIVPCIARKTFGTGVHSLIPFYEYEVGTWYSCYSPTDELSKVHDLILYLLLMENAYEMIYRTVAKPFSERLFVSLFIVARLVLEACSEQKSGLPLPVNSKIGQISWYISYHWKPSKKSAIQLTAGMSHSNS